MAVSYLYRLKCNRNEHNSLLLEDIDGLTVRLTAKFMYFFLHQQSAYQQYFCKHKLSKNGPFSDKGKT